MEFQELSESSHTRIDTKENQKILWNEKYLENLESILFEEGLVNKKILFDYEFPENHSVFKKTILYSDEKSSKSVLLYVNSILGSQIRRWDYFLYPTGDEEFKKKIKTLDKNPFIKYKGTAIFPQGDRDPLNKE